MKPFTYERANSPAQAAAAAARNPGAKFIAGGTNLLDLMKLQIEAPTHLIDVNGLALDQIETTPEGGLRIGAVVRNTALAAEACRGEGFVRAASEDANRSFRRSLYVVVDIPAGGVLTRQKVRAIRPGFGMPPKHFDEEIGNRARKALPRGTPLSWDVIGD